MTQSLEAAATRSMPLPGEARRKLLVVDDDMLALRALDKSLRAQEFEVFTARSIEQARQLIDLEQLDAALIDLCLDDGRGAWLVTELRGAAHPCCAVVITGTTQGDAA